MIDFGPFLLFVALPIFVVVAIVFWILRGE